MRSLRTALLVSAVAAFAWLAGCANQGNGSDAEGRRVVLVIGATGGTGVEVVRQAQAKGFAVRALVRDEGKARELLGDSVRYFVGNVRDPATLKGAFRGANLVVSALGSNSRRDPENSPELIDYGGVKSLAETAKAHGVQHFVLVSSMGVTDPDHPLNAEYDNLMTWKLRGENALRASGVAYTVVRPGALTNVPGGAAGLRLLQGDEKSLSGTVARADLAAVCVAALGRRSAFGKTFELLGEGEPRPTDWDGVFAALRTDHLPASSSN